MAMTLVETVEVGSGGAAAISFTSIPQTGKDLVVLISPRSTRVDTDDQLRITFNASSTGYRFRSLEGDGSGVGASDASPSSWITAGFYNAANNTANTFSNFRFYIMDYANTTWTETFSEGVMENNGALSFQNLVSGSWTGSAAITSIEIDAGIGNFAQYSTASLYIIS